jgi:hypothetical protein
MRQPLPPREEALRLAAEAARGTLMERVGLEWLEIETDRIVARIPVTGNTQVYGMLHGGATATLIESIGSVGTAVAIGLDKQVVGFSSRSTISEPSARDTSPPPGSRSGSGGASRCGRSGWPTTTTTWSRPER